MHLTPRQRIIWAAHAWKGVFNTYHRQLEPLLRAILDSDAVILDVGAHSGQCAKLFSRIAGSGGYVHALEPGALPGG